MFEPISILKEVTDDLRLIMSKQNPFFYKDMRNMGLQKDKYSSLLITFQAVIFFTFNLVATLTVQGLDNNLILYNLIFTAFFLLTLKAFRILCPEHFLKSYVGVLTLYVPLGATLVEGSSHYWIILRLIVDNLIIMKLKSFRILIFYHSLAILLMPGFFHKLLCESNSAFQGICNSEKDPTSIVILGCILHFIVSLSFKLSYEAAKLKNKELKSKLSKSEAELREAKSKLENLLMAQENFILSFSHEIRNPLNVVTANIDLSLEETELEQVKERLRTMKVCGEIILQFLNNILDGSKMEHGELEYSPKAVNFKKFISNYWVILKELAFQKKLETNLYLSKALPAFIRIDPHRVMQILLNLSNNAVKFTQKGEVAVVIDWIKKKDALDDDDFVPSEDFKGRFLVSKDGLGNGVPRKVSLSQINFDDEIDGMIETKEMNVKKLKNISEEPNSSQYYSLRALERNNVLIEKESFIQLAMKYEESVIELEEVKKYYLKIEVIDTGAGMSDEAVSRLFKKFSQVDSCPEKTKIGSGLGLWITRQLCEKMKGGIKVYSKMNRGTDFIAIIEAAPTDNSYIDSLPVSPVARKKSSNFIVGPITLRALVLCDDPTIIEDIKAKTYALNIVNVTTDVLQLVELYSKHKGRKYDLIIINNNMPQIDAKKTSEIIRRYEREKGLKEKPIIMIFQEMMDGETQHCLSERGLIRANYVFTIPIPEDEIRESLSKITRKVLSEMRGKVLVVDDDGFNLRLICQILEKYNISYLEAANGEQAVNMFMQEGEDIIFVLMDCEMPIKDGYEAAKEIKDMIKEKNLHDVPIIGLSAHTGEEHKKKALEYGMTNVFTKPLNLSDFVKVIKYFAEV